MAEESTARNEGPRPDGPGALALGEGVRLHRAGDLDGAERSYRAILAENAGHPGALNLLAMVHYQRQDYETALELQNQAVRLLPGNAEIQSNLGAIHYALRDMYAAEACFRRAVELDPEKLEANSNLAAILSDSGRAEEALPLYRKVAAAAPGVAKHHKRLAEVLLELGKAGEAAASLENYLALVPEDASALNNLGYCYEQQDRLHDAADLYVRAAALAPHLPELNNNAGGALKRIGETDRANVYLQKALDADPEDWEDSTSAAGAYMNAQNWVKALEIFEIRAQAEPRDADFWNNYGNILKAAGRVSDAITAYDRAIELRSDFGEAFSNRGSILLQNGDMNAAIENYKKALEINPQGIGYYVNLCIACLYAKRLDEAYIYAKSVTMHPQFGDLYKINPHKAFRSVCDFDGVDDLGDLFELIERSTSSDAAAAFLELQPLADDDEKTTRLADIHKKWGRELVLRIEEPLPPRVPRAHGSKLRVGFVSSDLRSHSVANFVLPIVKNYDRSAFEIKCFSPVDAGADPVQREIQGRVDDFQFLRDKSRRDTAAQIQDAGVDILFELNGFTKDSVIASFVYKPAPVQIYWLGYPFTTGLPEMDYILLDRYYRPENPDWLTEQELTMPDCWVCFDSIRDAPIEEKLPFERNGSIVFGTMNNTYKFTRDVIAVWAYIMNSVPDSQFLIVRPEADSVTMKHNIRAEFARHGIEPQRVNFIANDRNKHIHYGFYNFMDISLDTFPLTGGTTTCDALWMGCPVISLVGPSLHQRVSYSLIENVGAGELCCRSIEEYVTKAVMLANDPDSLREYRFGLRPALLNSPLYDAERYTRNWQELLIGVAERHGL